MKERKTDSSDRPFVRPSRPLLGPSFLIVGHDDSIRDTREENGGTPHQDGESPRPKDPSRPSDGPGDSNPIP